MSVSKVSNSQSGESSADILMIEDNPADVAMVRRFLDSSEIPYHLHKIMTGDEAERILLSDGNREASGDMPNPDLIILDLNLPGTDGRELLNRFKRDETLKSIPVIILTTSDLDADIEHAYTSGANTYIVKPESRDQFSDIVDTLESYWFQIAELPNN